MTQAREPITGYRIHQLLGEGGFAKVYLAEQSSLERQVALKVMFPTLAEDVDFCERFIREGRTLAKLGSHSDIVTIYDVGKQDRYYYMAMEYLPGTNLKERMSGNTLPEPPLTIIRNIASALGYAHDQGVVHRDVKPANILFSQTNKPVLSDFGIAKSLNDSDRTLTQLGDQIGTASYMSPEQWRGEADLDGRSDLYSLGVMLYEMLTGSKPYVAPDMMSVGVKHLNDPIPLVPAHHQNYQPLINRLMAKTPDDRYTNAHEFIDHLDQIESKSQAADTTVSANTSSTLYKAIGGGLAIVIATLALYFWINNKPVEETSIPLLAVPTAGLPEEIHDKVQRLLDSAQMHEIVGRLVAPPGSNALDAYEMVVELDGNNEFAKRAVKRLKDKEAE